ncbi:MAG: zinc metalloprotease HtpX [Chloroflexi bacterium]|nr:zinc metalloprotease HtpX [Chloroflexota bacterium]
MNTIKTLFLISLLTSLLLLIGYFVGGIGGILGFLIIALAMNFIGYWFSDRLVLALARAKVVTPEEEPELHKIVDEQVRLAAIPKPKVFIIRDQAPNAFATGRSKKHASIAVTEGITRLLSREELGGVIAHELAHVGNRDTLIMTIVAAIATAISMIAWMVQWAAIFGGGRRDSREGNALGIIGLLVIAIVMPIVATLIQLAISRTREYQADKTGAYTSGNPLALASALRKLKLGNKDRHLDVSKERLEPVSHLFIVNPLSGAGVVRLFSTHPPFEERVARLEAMGRQTLWPR